MEATNIIKTREAQARAEEGARRSAKPTHPEVLPDLESLELPVEVVDLLHTATGDALSRRGSPRAPPSGAVEETALRMPDPPGSGAIPLAILVSTPNPVAPHPLAMLWCRVYSRRPMLPANVPNRSTVPTRATGVPAKGRRPRWSARAERRVLAAGLALLIIGSALVLRWSLHGNREVPVPSARKAVPDLWTGNAGESQSEVDAQRKPLRSFKGQKQAPCDPGRGEIEVDQFCWWELKLDPSLPCPSESVRYNSKCLLPVPEGKRKSANEP